MFFAFSKNASAIYDPLSVPNNKFGIHIISENDLGSAANLVNSSGGDWGYVTFVITEAERNIGRWQEVFNQARRLHLIPIVRIATKPEGDIWQKPEEDNIDSWVMFLNSLNWVIKNRYVVISNEPNHAKEWGGDVKPDEYATYLKSFSQKLRAASEDFFVLPAGFDASAPNSRGTMNETKFIQAMVKKEPDIFNYVDGWTSHSYPNPDFSGKADARGKGTVATYDWELGYLKSLGVTKTLPVFITETGWSNKNLTEDQIGEKLWFAFNNVWSDKRVVAVTPFILNYKDSLFEEFSWVKKDESFYSFYDKVKNLAKVKGVPTQEVKGKILAVFINPFLLAGSSFSGVVLTQNLGQSIWVSPEVGIKDDNQIFEIETQEYDPVEPQKLRLINIRGEASLDPGTYEIPLVLKFKENQVSPPHLLDVVIVAPAELKKIGFFDKVQVYLGHFFSKKW